jgi:hypothetical protein
MNWDLKKKNLLLISFTALPTFYLHVFQCLWTRINAAYESMYLVSLSIVAYMTFLFKLQFCLSFYYNFLTLVTDSS